MRYPVNFLLLFCSIAAEENSETLMNREHETAERHSQEAMRYRQKIQDGKQFTAAQKSAVLNEAFNILRDDVCRGGIQ